MLLGLQMSSVLAPAGLSCQQAFTSGTKRISRHATPPAQQLTPWPKGTRCISAARAAPGEGAEPHRPSTGKASTSQPWGFSLPSLVRKVPFQPLYSAMDRMAVIPTVGHDPQVQD